MKSKPLFLISILFAALLGGYYSTTVYFVAKIEKKVLADADSTLCQSEKLTQYAAQDQLFGKSYFEYKSGARNGLNVGDMNIRYRFLPLPDTSSKEFESLSNETNYILKYRLINYLNIDYISSSETDKKGESLFRINHITDTAAVKDLLTMNGDFSFYELVDHERDRITFLQLKNKIEDLTAQSVRLSINDQSHQGAYYIAKNKRSEVDALIHDPSNPLGVPLPYRLFYGVDSAIFQGEIHYPLYLCEGTDDQGRGFSIGDYIVETLIQRTKKNGYSQIIIKTQGEDTMKQELFSTRNKGLTLAVVIDDQVYMTPRVKSTITDGYFALSGPINYSKARVLAAVIMNRRLPLKVEIVATDYVPVSITSAGLESRYTTGIAGIIISAIALIAALVGLCFYCVSLIRTKEKKYVKAAPEDLFQLQAMFRLLKGMYLVALITLSTLIYLNAETSSWMTNGLMVLFTMLFTIGIVLFFLREKSGWYLSVLCTTVLCFGSIWYLSNLSFSLQRDSLNTIAYLCLSVLYAIHALIMLFDKPILALFGLGAVTVNDDQVKAIIGQRVSIVKRFLDYMFDYIVILGIFYAIIKISDISILNKWIPGLIILIYYSYYLILEYFTGRTIGKWIFSTKVVSYYDGGKPSFKQIAIRSFMRLIPLDSLSYILGWHWHDNVSGTTVINA